jgi:hypothetical protein
MPSIEIIDHEDHRDILMSGDVEQNPGPDDEDADEADASDDDAADEPN